MFKQLFFVILSLSVGFLLYEHESENYFMSFYNDRISFKFYSGSLLLSLRSNRSSTITGDLLEQLPSLNYLLLVWQRVPSAGFMLVSGCFLSLFILFLTRFLS